MSAHLPGFTNVSTDSALELRTSKRKTPYTIRNPNPFKQQLLLCCDIKLNCTAFYSIAITIVLFTILHLTNTVFNYSACYVYLTTFG